MKNALETRWEGKTMFKNLCAFRHLLFYLFVACLICIIGCSKRETGNTIKIGVEAFLGSDQSLDWTRAVELMAEQDNKNGGIDIGGNKYKVELVLYDSKATQTAELSAINRLVYEDKVKFIISEGKFCFSWLPTVEKEKVVAFNAAIPTPASLGPQYHYSFNTHFANPMITVFTAWYFKKYPDERNSFVAAFPDNQFGHMLSQYIGAVFGSINIKPTILFFPAGSSDLSSLVTKVKQLNPKLFTCVAPSVATQGGIFNSIRKSGYNGKFILPILTTTHSLVQIMTPEALEGFICPAAPFDFDPPLTQVAMDFKDHWIKKYDKWKVLTITFSSAYCALKEALIKTGSTDSDKVAETLNSGLKFESPMGEGKMISRPDFGNDRTVDSICTYYVKQMKNGKPVLFDTISMDEGMKIFRKAYPPAAPGGGGMPSGFSGPPDK